MPLSGLAVAANRDNRLTLLEWTGDATRFIHLDRNREGVISPSEWPRR